MESIASAATNTSASLDALKNQTNESIDTKAGAAFQWTALTILQSVALFIAGGLAEIGGGWLIWKSIRDKKPYLWAILGSVALVVYGFLPTLQPTDSFGRIYAVYGGYFIVMSFLMGWWWDGDRPDKGDIIGGLIALAGVCIIMFWPRGKQ